MDADTLTPPSVPPRQPGQFTVRCLPPEEWEARKDALPQYPRMPDPQFSLLVVVEDHRGAIVASWQAINTVHLEGLYVDPKHRRDGSAILTTLLSGMLQALNEGRVPSVLTIAQEASIITLAQKVGFVIVPGTLLQLDLRKGY